MPQRCVLDCDPGHDDAIAILVAAAVPELDVRAITTVAGNGTVDQTTTNALKVVALTGAAIPVAAGAARPLRGRLVTAANIHGSTALDGPDLIAEARLDPRSAHQVLADVLSSADDLTTIIATGPLTNIALLLQADPEVVPRIREIVLMGGSVDRGNITPAAEFNIYVDPDAAACVFESGVPVRMAGLNVTHQAVAESNVRGRIRALDNAVAAVVDQWLTYFAETYRAQFGFSSPPIHDACAVVWAALPEVIKATPAFVAVELAGTWTRGATVVDLDNRLSRAPNASVGRVLARERFWDFVIGALSTYGPREMSP